MLDGVIQIGEPILVDDRHLVERGDELVAVGGLQQILLVHGHQLGAAAVKAIVAELGASGPGDMGKVMGVVKTRLAGKADMGQVSAAVKAALAG